MTHNEYIEKFCDGKSRTQENSYYGYQCTAQCKHYCSLVRGYQVGRFGGTAYKGRVNRKSTFYGKKHIKGFSVVPQGSVVIFKPYAKVLTKKPGASKWEETTFGIEGHVAIVDYIDDDGVIRVIEQNGATGDGDGMGGDEIRIRGYKGKNTVCGFILKSN